MNFQGAGVLEDFDLNHVDVVAPDGAEEPKALGGGGLDGDVRLDGEHANATGTAGPRGAAGAGGGGDDSSDVDVVAPIPSLGDGVRGQVGVVGEGLLKLSPARVPFFPDRPL